MTVLAKLRRAARPLAIVIAMLATIVSTNAFAVAARAKVSTASHCQSEHMDLADRSGATTSADHLSSTHSSSTHGSCCDSDCDCPFAAGVYALSLIAFYALPPTASVALFPPVLPLEDRRPSDLLRPPI